MTFAHRGYEEVEGRCEHTESCSHDQVAKRPLYQFEVLDSYSETYADDWAHEWGYEHCADDYGSGVGVESERCDEYRKYKDENVGATECHTFAYGVFGLILRDEVVIQAEIFNEVFAYVV